MPNTYFQFKDFRIEQAVDGMKVTTDGCIFGALIKEVQSGNILDIGTGTGILALMIAQRTKARIDAIEIDPLVSSQAQLNIDRAPWKDQIRLFNEDINTFQSDVSYNQIVCNPPFFKNNYKGKSQTKNAAIHDDSLSMESLLNNITRLLADHGSFWIMYPAYEMEAFDKLARGNGFSPRQKTRIYNKPQGPIFRVVCEYVNTEASTCSANELTIKTELGAYTQAFEQLLKPYYLHL